MNTCTYHKNQLTLYGGVHAVPCLVTLRPLCKIFLVALRADPEFSVSATGQYVKNFLAHNCAFWSSLNMTHD